MIHNNYFVIFRRLYLIAGFCDKREKRLSELSYNMKKRKLKVSVFYNSERGIRTLDTMGMNHVL